MPDEVVDDVGIVDVLLRRNVFLKFKLIQKVLLKQYNRMMQMFFAKVSSSESEFFLFYNFERVDLKASLKIAIHRSLVMKKNCGFENSYKEVVNIND